MKIKVYKLECPSQSLEFVDQLLSDFVLNVQTVLARGKLGDKVTLEITEMEDTEFNSLEEFEV